MRAVNEIGDAEGIRQAACPVDGPVAVRYVKLGGRCYGWCQRSYLVCEVTCPSSDCPLKHSPEPIPFAARWACPLLGDPIDWPALVGKV